MLRALTSVLAPALLAVVLVAPPGAHAAYTGTVGSGTGRLAGGGAGDTLVVDKSASYLRHNRKAAGDPGFASSLDFDTTATGEQRVSNSGTGALVVYPGEGDHVVLGSATFPAGTLAAPVYVHDPETASTLTIDDSAGATPRTMTVGDGSVQGATAAAVDFFGVPRLVLKAGKAADVVILDTNDHRTDLLGGAGEDVLRFADDGSAMGGGSFDGGGALDEIDYGGRTQAVNVDLGDGTATGLASITGVSDVTGGAGADRITGSPYANTLRGGPGNDDLDGGIGKDVLDGGAGTGDTIDYSARTGRVRAALNGAADDGMDADGDGVTEEHDQDIAVERLVGGDGADILVGNDRPNVLTGNAGTDWLLGGVGPDTLEGGSDADTLEGHGDNDDLIGGLGPDMLDGGAGTGDRMSYPGRLGRVLVRLDGNPNDGYDPDGNGVSFNGEEQDHDIGIEHATGGLGDDRLIGGPGRNFLLGGDGDDTLEGGKGPDVLNGQLGTDTIDYTGRINSLIIALDGLPGDGEIHENDHDLGVENAIGGEREDVITATGNVRNVLLGGDGNDRLDGGPGADVLDGGAHVDRIEYDRRDAGRLAITLDGIANDGADPDGDGVSTRYEEGDRDVRIEDAFGGQGDDRLTGTRVGQSLWGGDGNDRLFGLGGDDRLFGGKGDDILDGGFGDDWLHGEDGIDTITYGLRTASQPVVVTLDAVANDGQAGELDYDYRVENVRGGAGDDRLTAASPGRVNVLYGGAGDDDLKTREGAPEEDLLVCQSGTDRYDADPTDEVFASCETTALLPGR